MVVGGARSPGRPDAAQDTGGQRRNEPLPARSPRGDALRPRCSRRPSPARTTLSPPPDPPRSAPRHRSASMTSTSMPPRARVRPTSVSELGAAVVGPGSRHADEHRAVAAEPVSERERQALACHVGRAGLPGSPRQRAVGGAAARQAQRRQQRHTDPVGLALVTPAQPSISVGDHVHDPGADDETRQGGEDRHLTRRGVHRSTGKASLAVGRKPGDRTAASSWYCFDCRSSSSFCSNTVARCWRATVASSACCLAMRAASVCAAVGTARGGHHHRDPACAAA